MTRAKLRELIWQELDRQDQVGCLHKDERLDAIMGIVVDKTWTIIGTPGVAPITLAEKVTG
jgi:predicted amidohydrolase